MSDNEHSSGAGAPTGAAALLDAAFDLLGSPALWVATLALVAAWVFLARVPTKSESRVQRQDMGKLFESLKEYATEHKFVFNVLMGVTAISMLLFTLLATVISPKKPHSVTYEDFFLAIFAGVGGALLILVMTDYASKRYFATIIERLEPKLTSIFTSSQVSAKISAEYGLYAFPSATRLNRPAVNEFKEHLEDGETVCVSASSGMRWLNRKTDARPVENNLAELAKRPVKLHIAIFSPLLALQKLFSHAALEPSAKQLYGMLKAEIVNLSQHDPIEILRFHIDASTRIRDPRSALESVNPGFELEVRVLSSPPVCEYFTIGRSRVYASFPLCSRQSLDSPALHIYDPPKGADPNLVDTFLGEFALIWDHAMPFQDYITKNDAIIREILKLSIDDHDAVH